MMKLFNNNIQLIIEAHDHPLKQLIQSRLFLAFNYSDLYKRTPQFKREYYNSNKKISVF